MKILSWFIQTHVDPNLYDFIFKSTDFYCMDKK